MRLTSKPQREIIVVRRFKRFTVKFTVMLWMQLKKFTHLAHLRIVIRLVSRHNSQ